MSEPQERWGPGKTAAIVLGAVFLFLLVIAATTGHWLTLAGIFWIPVFAPVLLIMLIPFLALRDLIQLHRRTGEPWGSVDVLWAISFFAFHLMGGIAWFVWGKNIRTREVEEMARMRSREDNPL